MSKAEELGPGGVNEVNRPVFIASDRANYVETLDHPLSKEEKLKLKEFQLWRTLRSIERRDEIYQSLTSSTYAAYTRKLQVLGTPYPIIEPNTTLYDCIKCIRPYEHILSFLGGFVASRIHLSFPANRSLSHISFVRSTFVMLYWLIGEFYLCNRSGLRLKGEAENDYECMKYGVLETKERLEQRKERWEKYAAFKEEWCRRYDFHVFNMRPGERYKFLSPCLFPPRRPKFMQKTDYPLRKNPDILTTTPLRDMFHEAGSSISIPQNDNIPLLEARPELRWKRPGPNEVYRNINALTQQAASTPTQVQEVEAQEENSVPTL